MGEIMKRKQPDKWIDEIQLAIADVREAKPFGVETRVTPPKMGDRL
jgi:hypothetical protein